MDEFFKRQGANALNSTIFRQYIVMDVYFCVASFLEELQVGREEISSFDVNSELLQSKEHAVKYVTRIIEKAVELGVYEIIPVAMKYCVVKLDEKKAEKKVARWQEIARSAAKQSKRSMIPSVHPVMSFREAAAYARECELNLVPYENEEGMAATACVQEKLADVSSVSVFIGPEGGFAEEEIDALREYSEVISLGQRILRTDTAAITTLSMLMLQLEMLK